MKYHQEALDEVEAYCAKLSLEEKLDYRLVHIPRTKLQADMLYEIQSDCELIYSDDYFMAKRNDTSDPYRETLKVVKAIDTLEKHLYNHHLGAEIEMIAQLQALKKRLDINDRLKPKDILDFHSNEIRERLKSVGFKDTNINEKILPIFKDIIKDN